MRVRHSAWWLSALLSLACGSGEDEEDLLGGCDIRTEDCQRATFAAAARARGQTGLRMPPIRTIGLDEFRAELDASRESEEPDQWDASLPLLGLLPESTTIEEAYADSSVASVAAYYDTETESITIIDRGERTDPLDDVFVLAHEFGHFLQDRERPLDEFREQWAESLDAFVALTALIEGEATVVGVSVVAEALDTVPHELDWQRFLASLRSGAFTAIEESPVPFVAGLQLLPYPLGTEQVAPLWLVGGPRAVQPLYEGPRLSLLDWAEDTAVIRPSRLEPLECEPTAAPPGFAAVGWDAFGMLGVLAALVGAGERSVTAWDDALDFRGDRVVLFEQEGVPGSLAVAWRIRFESGASASAYSAAIAATGVTSSVAGREVLVRATTDLSQLPPWLEVDHCGTVAELPERAASSAEEAALRRRLGRARFR